MYRLVGGLAGDVSESLGVSSLLDGSIGRTVL